MAMRENGLVKLSEECAEVIQVAQKLIAYQELQANSTHAFPPLHPDGTHLRSRLEEELGDAYAALQFVVAKLDLDFPKILQRFDYKLALFHKWDKEP